MTSDSRAVSMASLVIVLRLLISMMRRVWANRRWTRRKLPPVMRATAAMASVSVKSSTDRVRLSLDQWCCRIKSSSSAESVRYSWTKPILL